MTCSQPRSRTSWRDELADRWACWSAAVSGIPGLIRLEITGKLFQLSAGRLRLIHPDAIQVTGMKCATSDLLSVANQKEIQRSSISD